MQGIIANDQIMIVGNEGYGLFNVKGVSFSVQRDQRFVILGASSSGTSAILTTVCGLKVPVHGEARVNKLDVASRSFKQRYLHSFIGYQLQSNNIDEDLTVN